jgi:hypothetical protein
VTRLRKTMLEELQRRNLSELTAGCYRRAIEEFSRFHNRPPDQLAKPAVSCRESPSGSWCGRRSYSDNVVCRFVAKRRPTRGEKRQGTGC